MATPGALLKVTAFFENPCRADHKSIAFRTEHGLVVALARGDHEINDVKVQNLVGAIQIRRMKRIFSVNWVVVAGFLGPVGLAGKCTIVADSSVMNLHDAVCGASAKPDEHCSM